MEEKMKILAIDTSSKICSVAILEDDEIIDELNLDDGKTHSENLMPLVDEILRKNNINIKQIEMIACSVGPGSFTGIRIGVATIKPIAEVLNIKIASVTSLETLAKNVENEETIVSLIDARNNQVYCGIFDKDYNAKQDYIADDINVVIDKLKKYDKITFVGDGAILHKDLLNSNFSNIKFAEKNEQSAGAVGKIGYKKYLEKNTVTADEIVPIYLRKSQAERLKKN
jgi:tRNA threonylcarbamoyladenosine biosynthesis protein TsaB